MTDRSSLPVAFPPPIADRAASRWRSAGLAVLPYLLASGLTLMAGLALAHFDAIEYDQRIQAQRTEVGNRLEVVRGNLERIIVAPLMRSRGVAAQIIAHGDISADDFGRIADALVRGQDVIRDITVSRGYLIQMVYPLAGNEVLQGVNYRDLTEQWPSVQRAVEQHHPTLQGPLPLLQGGTGLVLRDPIYLPTPQGDHFYGLVGIALDMDRVLARSGVTKADFGLRLGIRGRDGNGLKGDMVFGDEMVFTRQPVEMDLQLPDGQWRLGAIPKGGWQSPDADMVNIRILEACLLLGVALITFGTARHVTVRRRLVEALTGAEESFRLVTENVPDYGIFMLDGWGRVRHWTTGAERLTGLSSREVLGKPFGMTYPPEEQAAGRPAALLQEAQRMGRATREGWHIRKSGERFHASIVVSRILDAAGSVIGYAVIGRDSTASKRIEDLLSKQAERFQLLLRTASDGLHVLDEHGDLVEASDSFYRMLGYPPKDGRLKNVAQWEGRCQENALADRLRGLFEQPGVFESRHRRQDGSLFDVEVNCRIAELDGGRYLYCSSRDITDRKTTEMTRRRSEIELQAATARLKLVLDTAAEGILGVDDENRIIFANKAAVEMLGWPSPESLQGKNAETVMGHRLHDHRPCSEGYCPIRTTLADGQLRRVTDEFFVGRDGPERPVEYVVSPLSVEDITVGAVIVFHDITASIQAEQNIRHLLTYQRAILDNTPVGIAILAQNRVIVQANETFCRIFGQDSRVLCGQTADVLYTSKELYEEVGERAYPLVANGTTFCEEVPMRRADDSTIWVRLVARMVDVGNPDLGYVWAAEDITDRRALDLDLRRSNAELERFAYVASHDLRQPLRMISSYLSLIERRLGERLDEEEHHFLDFAVDGAHRMDRMIVDLLDYSRIGRKGGAMVEVSLQEALDCATTNLGPTIRETGAEVVVQSPLPTIKGSETELERLFQNLISNAVKFHKPDLPPRVEIGCREERDEWVLSVRDNGIGIAPENHDRLFAIFQRLVSREQYEGTGIGLAACRKIAEHHGGRIWLDSQLGEGCTFYVALPKG